MEKFVTHCKNVNHSLDVIPPSLLEQSQCSNAVLKATHLRY